MPKEKKKKSNKLIIILVIFIILMLFCIYILDPLKLNLPGSQDIKNTIFGENETTTGTTTGAITDGNQQQVPIIPTPPTNNPPIQPDINLPTNGNQQSPTTPTAPTPPTTPTAPTPPTTPTAPTPPTTPTAPTPPTNNSPISPDLNLPGLPPI